MPQKQKLSVEENVAIVQMYLRGEISITIASKTCGVDRKTIKDWIRNYEAEGI